MVVAMVCALTRRVAFVVRVAVCVYGRWDRHRRSRMGICFRMRRGVDYVAIFAATSVTFTIPIARYQRRRQTLTRKTLNASVGTRRSQIGRIDDSAVNRSRITSRRCSTTTWRELWTTRDVVVVSCGSRTGGPRTSWSLSREIGLKRFTSKDWSVVYSLYIYIYPYYSINKAIYMCI